MTDPLMLLKAESSLERLSLGTILDRKGLQSQGLEGAQNSASGAGDPVASLFRSLLEARRAPPPPPPEPETTRHADAENGARGETASSRAAADDIQARDSRALVASEAETRFAGIRATDLIPNPEGEAIPASTPASATAAAASETNESKAAAPEPEAEKTARPVQGDAMPASEESAPDPADALAGTMHPAKPEPLQPDAETAPAPARAAQPDGTSAIPAERPSRDQPAGVEGEGIGSEGYPKGRADSQPDVSARTGMDDGAPVVPGHEPESEPILARPAERTTEPGHKKHVRASDAEPPLTAPPSAEAPGEPIPASLAQPASNQAGPDRAEVEPGGDMPDRADKPRLLSEQEPDGAGLSLPPTPDGTEIGKDEADPLSGSTPESLPRDELIAAPGETRSPTLAPSSTQVPASSAAPASAQTPAPATPASTPATPASTPATPSEPAARMPATDPDGGEASLAARDRPAPAAEEMAPPLSPKPAASATPSSQGAAPSSGANPGLSDMAGQQGSQLGGQAGGQSSGQQGQQHALAQNQQGAMNAPPQGQPPRPADAANPDSPGQGILTEEEAERLNLPAGRTSTGELDGVDFAQKLSQANQSRSPQHVHQQVTVALRQMAAQGRERLTIRLDPEQLGRLEIRLDIGADGKTRTHIMAETQQTLDLLRGDQRGLERALQNAGLDTTPEGMSFSLRRDGNADPNQFARERAGPGLRTGIGDAESDQEKEDIHLTLQPGIRPDGRVDIRI